MSSYRLFQASLLVLAVGCSDSEGPLAGSEVSYTEARQPCVERDPHRQLMWGDLHAHTKASWDAYGYGLTVSAAQAYGFATGQAVSIPGPDGPRSVRIDRPLDFAATTDHSELLGETRLCTTAGSAAYGSKTCAAFRKGGTAAVSAWGLQLIVPEGQQRQADVCGADGTRCLESARTVWQELGQAAEAAYDRSSACAFATLRGYEYTATPKATNMHRNVIFRNDKVPELPVSYYEAPQPLQLWRALDQQCNGADEGCEAMVIPHNMNLSDGNMFTTAAGLGGEALTPEMAELRRRMEPLLEVFQHKGDQECAQGLGGAQGEDDAQCRFEKERPPPIADCGEKPGWGGMNSMGCLSRWDFLRGILLGGLQQQLATGLNPYMVGVVGSTDTHNGTPGNTWEQGWPGHVGDSDDSAEERLGDGNVTHRGLVNNPGGLAAVWAVERSRDAIFEAMKRRETYATSGTRIRVRLFAGWQLPADMCQRPERVAVGYGEGVPMGGTLPKRPSGAAGPSLALWAEHDAGTSERPGALLQRLQIIKGWIDGGGIARYRVVDVAGSEQGSVDPSTCATDGAGSTSLCAVWQDPEFDPSQHAFYYARVLEVPTCRWSTHLCNAFAPTERPPGCSSDKVQSAIQERAWTSSVWYGPGS